MKAVLKNVSLIAIATALFSGASFASDSSLDEAKYSLYNNYVKGNSFQIGGENVSLVNVSAWADTGGYSDNYLRQGSTPGWWNCGSHSSADCVQEAGFGQENADYGDEGDSHSIDNFFKEGTHDFDMYLLSFDREVILTGAGYTWKKGSNGEKEVTVAGLNDISMFDNSKYKTWADASATGNVISSGHYGITATSGSLFQSSFTNLTAAKYWLVGAYNTFFDDNVAASYNGVGFKLSSLAVGLEKSPPPNTQVSEPGALALMSLGLGLVLYRRKRRV